MENRKQKDDFFVEIISDTPGVTGSCMVVKVHYPDKRIESFLVDSGLFQDDGYEKFNWTLPEDMDNLDFGLLTHIHMDHAGRIPFLVKNGWDKPFYMSQTSKNLSFPAFNNSAKVQESECVNTRKPPLYTSNDLEYTFPLLKGMEYCQTFKPIEGGRLEVTLFSNSHLIGANFILVQCKLPRDMKYHGAREINILFCGDYNVKNAFYEAPSLPDWVKELPLTVVSESTYGTTNREDIEVKFEKDILRYLKKKKKIVIPVAALNKAQEVLYFFKKLEKRIKLPNIYLDGTLAIEYTNMYPLLREIESQKRNFKPSGLILINNTNREQAINAKTGVIITTSAMATHGPAQTHVPAILSNPNGVLYFVSYCAQNTLGRDLLEAKEQEEVTIAGSYVLKKECIIDNTQEMSSHAKGDELISFLEQFTNLKLVIVNHGEQEVKEDFIKKLLGLKMKAIDLGQAKVKINQYGFIKRIARPMPAIIKPTNTKSFNYSAINLDEYEEENDNRSPSYMKNRDIKLGYKKL